MIVYAPRRVTLAPREPQTIRIAARAPKDLPDGEYRVHLLFRAVPPPQPVEAPKDEGDRLLPDADLRRDHPGDRSLRQSRGEGGYRGRQADEAEGKPAINIQLTRSGDRSTFGEIRVMKAGIKDPIASVRGVAIYTEIGDRSMTFPIEEQYASAATGRVTVQYVEPSDNGPQTIAETDAVLN